MKQKTINQNKLQTLLCIIALTLGVLVSAVLFSVTPVHAASVTPKGSLIFESSSGDILSDVYTNYVRVYSEDNPPVHFAGLIRYDELDKGDSATVDYIMYTTDINSSFSFYSGTETQYKDTSKNPYISYYQFTSDVIQIYTLSDGTKVRASTGGAGKKGFSFSPYLPLYNGTSAYPSFTSQDATASFLEHLLITGNLKPTNPRPNTQDESYSFTGFTMNGKTARWTGTTERSYAKEVDVEEYVKVSYAWATTTEPDNLGELQSYDGEFPTSDKQLTLPWSEMEKGKTDFQFIRQVKISPCYRVPHLAYYIGQPVTIYYNTDGSIDKISNPNTPGVLDDSIPIPVLSVNNDKGTFLFANAQNNYKFELKGRFWSTDDFYVFRKMPSLVWQYKYLTLLKNSLTTWVSVGDNMSTLSTYSFGDLGKESWNDLLNTYPIENRNIITGEQQGWLSWANITGYNDAITTLKTLLSTPYSLFNGYEVYVRYYVVCDDGSIKYSKWTHYFNNLADADGSTGSIVDDASNMNNGSQSDKGLTDSDMDNVENSGNSRNDVDAKPSNDFSVEISDITGLFNQFINILKSLYSGMGQLPSLVNAIFGFLPSWASTMIGISLLVIIILRIIGR